MMSRIDPPDASSLKQGTPSVAPNAVPAAYHYQNEPTASVVAKLGTDQENGTDTSNLLAGAVWRCD